MAETATDGTNGASGAGGADGTDRAGGTGVADVRAAADPMASDQGGDQGGDEARDDARCDGRGIADRDDPIARRGLMLVLSSPTAAGKSTIARQLLAQDPRFALSVSWTTRDRRPSEIDGTHYHFRTRREFERMRDREGLLEWAEVHGNFYGTPRDPVDEALEGGRDMLFDVDYQGARQMRERVPDDMVSVFILPPSMRELKQRLRRRAEDSEESMRRRLVTARTELEQWRDYDYVVVNDDLQRAFEGVRAIVTAERARRTRRPGLEAFVQGLLDEDA